MEQAMQETAGDRETYAAHTNGLPKTDFLKMRDIANGIIGRRCHFAGDLQSLLSNDGCDVGNRVMQACDKMELALAKVNFNAFADPSPKQNLTAMFEDVIVTLATVYLVRNRVRQFDMPGMQTISILYRTDTSLKDDMGGLFHSLVSLAEDKDREYGASWCKRGGIGAWFTTVRKFDRLITQVKQKGNDIWNVSDEAGSTESLEETIKDGINYLLLILEKRYVIYMG